MATLTPSNVDTNELRTRVQDMYRMVADEPTGEFHFEMGRPLAERLGYPSDELDQIPSAAIESFAGVGYYFDLANLRKGESVLDLGSGSGMDSFLAARKVGPTGSVIGIDMTDAQLEKATRLARDAGIQNITFQKSYIETLNLEDSSINVVISNGVINLCPDKKSVFREIARVLKRHGRMAIADIVTEKELPEKVTCDASLWAACIGGALQQKTYRTLIEDAGLRINAVREQPDYRFLSKSAQGASRDYGVKSICLEAEKMD
jgi:ubiquinone/menaquinone biosynthesis C-methylase UbiE